MRRLALLSAFLALPVLGCSAQLGPVGWDVCGWDGGVVFELEVMQQRMALGCSGTDPRIGRDSPEPEVCEE